MSELASACGINNTDPADEELMPWTGKLKAPIDKVIKNIRSLGLGNQLDEERLQIHKGWFENTLPRLESEHIAVLRMDGDSYKSTTEILQNLYHKVSHGGVIIVDDYVEYKACQKAIHRWFDLYNIPRSDLFIPDNKKGLMATFTKNNSYSYEKHTST